jgi:hypothetical protein
LVNALPLPLSIEAFDYYERRRAEHPTGRVHQPMRDQENGGLWFCSSCPWAVRILLPAPPTSQPLNWCLFTYYRLNVLSVYLPPLRERRDDIVLLAEHLLSRHTPENILTPVLSPELKQAMIEYAWPGNIRELENIIRRLIVLGDQQIISCDLLRRTKINASTPSDDLTALARSIERPGSGLLDRVQKAKVQAESDAILAALNATRWNRKRAAESLGIDYKILLYRMKKLRLDEEPAHVGSDPA